MKEVKVCKEILTQFLKFASQMRKTEQILDAFHGESVKSLKLPLGTDFPSE